MARILLVEDHPDNLSLMVYLLESSGHETSQAMTGNDGIRLATVEAPDLIVLDLQLPDINGYEVLRQIRGGTATRHIAAIAVSAFAMVGDRERVLRSGFSGYLSKPITPETFVRQVERFIPQSRAVGHGAR